MTQVAILGSTIEALEQAHSILDKSPSSQITIYTEDAEVGFPEPPSLEELILRVKLDSIPEAWVSNIPNTINPDLASTTAASWLCKSMAVRLAMRGVRFLLRTSILDVETNQCEISFRGGGLVGSGVDSYDELHDFR